MKIEYEEFCKVFDVVIGEIRQKQHNTTTFVINGDSGTNINKSGDITKYNFKVLSPISKNFIIPVDVGGEKTICAMKLMEKYELITIDFNFSSYSNEGQLFPHVTGITPRGIYEYEKHFLIFRGSEKKECGCSKSTQFYKKNNYWFRWYLIKYWFIFNIVKSKWVLWWISIFAYVISNWDTIKLLWGDFISLF